MSISSSVRDKLLDSTGFFEGDDGYSNLAGNFDGQGISFGIIQFNFGQGSLQALLEEYINEYESEFEDIFGSSKAETLREVVFDYTKSQQISWATSISTGSNNQNVVSSWATPFREIGRKSHNQYLQKKHAQKYVDRAESWAEDFGIISTQGLAFLFDQAVHEWSFAGSTSDIEDEIDDADYAWRHSEGERLPDRERLSILLNYVRTSDGRARRRAIMNGSGTVHGKDYDVDDFDLSYDDEF